MRVVGDSNVFIYLEAREKGKPLVGTVKQLNSKTRKKREKYYVPICGWEICFENEEAKKTLATRKVLIQGIAIE